MLNIKHWQGHGAGRIPMHSGGYVSWHNHFEKQLASIYQSLICKVPYVSIILLLLCTQQKCMHIVYQKNLQALLLQHYS